MREPRWIRRLWTALASIVCAALVLGVVATALPAAVSGAPPSLFDVHVEPTARLPQVPAEPSIRPPGRRVLHRRDSGTYGAIDLTSCAEARHYYALGVMPVVTDHFSQIPPRDAFVSVTYVDYGDDAVAARRLRPLMRPAAHCFGQAAAAYEDTDRIDVPAVDRVEIVAYRFDESRMVAVVKGNDGRAVVLSTARLSEDELRSMVAAAAEFVSAPSTPAPD